MGLGHTVDTMPTPVDSSRRGATIRVEADGSLHLGFDDPVIDRMATNTKPLTLVEAVDSRTNRRMLVANPQASLRFDCSCYGRAAALAPRRPCGIHVCSFESAAVFVQAIPRACEIELGPVVGTWLRNAVIDSGVVGQVFDAAMLSTIREVWCSRSISSIVVRSS